VVSNQLEGAAMTTLNGWQRLWLLASILWAVAILALTGTPDRGWTMQSALFGVRLWIVPVAAVYAFGLGGAWVMRGFQAESR
jgi:hypothetical protein